MHMPILLTEAVRGVLSDGNTSDMVPPVVRVDNTMTPPLPKLWNCTFALSEEHSYEFQNSALWGIFGQRPPKIAFFL